MHIVAARVGVKVSTAYSIVRKFRADGYRFPPRQSSHPFKLEPIASQLTSSRLLAQWQCLSLNQRAVKIKERWRIQCSGRTLLNFYRRHNVNHIAPGRVVSLIGVDIPRRLAAQVQFVQDIVRYLDEGRELWFMDETTFNLGM